MNVSPTDQPLGGLSDSLVDVGRGDVGSALPSFVPPLPARLTKINLGPVQPFTVGPLRVILICEGDRVLAAHLQSGYAYRALAKQMTRCNWRQAGDLAAQVDPMAPLAGRIAYLRALEHLSGRCEDLASRQCREVLLGLERAESHLAWATRFLHMHPVWGMQTSLDALYAMLSEAYQGLWQHLEREPDKPLDGKDRGLTALAAVVKRQSHSVLKSRSLARGLKGIGNASVKRMRQLGISGPVWNAGRIGGDCWSRLKVRLDEVSMALTSAISLLSTMRMIPRSALAIPEGPDGRGGRRAPGNLVGHGVAMGPRGLLGVSIGPGEHGPQSVAWSRPSIPVLRLVPEILVGSSLSSAEIILSSLDLSMAEADG